MKIMEEQQTMHLNIISELETRFKLCKLGGKWASEDWVY